MNYNAITNGSEVMNMAKTATLNMRLEPEIKQEAESLYSSLGLTLTEAINIFLHKSIMEGGIPFDVKQPRYNQETEAAMGEARDIMNGKVKAQGYKNASELFEGLDE
jgi:DNA-damage-inducible protein J